MDQIAKKVNVRLHRLTLLTNHAHVIVLIAQKPDIRMREIAASAGITERAVQRIIDDLVSSGCMVVTKDGRRNRYELRHDFPLHHPVELSRTLGDLVRFMLPEVDAA